MNIEDLKSILDAFDPGALLPEMDALLGGLTGIIRFLLLAVPIVMLILGLGYLFLAPKEANYHFGYRCFFGMGSVEAWRYTQRIAGLIWAPLGLVLTIVMFIITGSFAEKAATEVLSSALRCVLWEGGLAIAACIAIHVLVGIHFTASGDRRLRK